MPLQITHDKDGTHVILVVAGDLDLASATTLVEQASDLIDAGAHDIIVDATALAFCDSSGLGAFVRIANRLRPGGGRLAIAGPSLIVRRVLEVSGLVEAFVITDDVGAAVAQLGGSS
jgi:anti-sigma B factor antagonist